MKNRLRNRFITTITIFLALLLNVGCTPSPESMVESIKAGDRDIAKKEITRRLDSIANVEWFSGGTDHSLALYRLAFDREIYDLAAEGYLRSIWFSWKLNFPIDELTSGLRKEQSALADYIEGEAYRYGGNGYRMNDVLATKHFIESMIGGYAPAKHYLIGLYKEYQCDSQVLLFKKMGAREADARMVTSSRMLEVREIDGPSRMDIERDRQKLYKLIDAKGSAEKYPFDSECTLDVAVSHLYVGSHVLLNESEG